VSRPQTLTPETAQHLKYPTQWQTTSHPLYFLPAEPKFIKTQKPGKKSSVTFVFTRCCALNWLFFWTLLNVEAFFYPWTRFFNQFEASPNIRKSVKSSVFPECFQGCL
jgi:hypothetical protein